MITRKKKLRSRVNGGALNGDIGAFGAWGTSPFGGNNPVPSISFPWWNLQPISVFIARFARSGWAMAAREHPAIYRLHAAHCMEIAARTADTESKITLLNMARAWLLLAEKAEKSSKTTYETLAEVLAPSP
jgi:hypothetical protein